MPAFREFIVRPSAVRILAFINVSYLGLAGLNYDEYCNLLACDVDLLERVVDQSRDTVVGIKVRIGTEGVCGGRMEPLVRALEAGERCDLPVMCHISETPPPVEDVLPLLRPGDIVTHAFTGLSERIVDENGRLRDEARRARDRGVIFDVGHGAGSFSFETGEALAAEGFWPDVISTDLHQMSLPGPNLLDPLSQELVARVKGDGTPQFTLLTVMSKFLHLGMPFAEVIRATTRRPAEALGRADEIGSLAPGAAADVALLEIEEGAVRPLRHPREPPAGDPDAALRRDLGGRSGAAHEGHATGAAVDQACRPRGGLRPRPRQQRRPPGSSRVPGGEGSMKTAGMVFASDLRDEGVDTVLGNLRDRGGLDGVELAAAYHHARDVYPHNPLNPVHFPDGGAIFFRPDPRRWEGVRLQPVQARMLDEFDPLAEVLREGDRRGMTVRAWTNTLHNFTLGEAHPDCVARNAFGNPLLTDLCPANPASRAYARAVSADLSRYGVEAIAAEAICYLPFDHGFHHERCAYPLSETVRFLLALCFCDHCQGAAGMAGVDVRRVREPSAATRCRRSRASRARSTTCLSSGRRWRGWPKGKWRGYLGAREQVVTSLVAEVTQAVEAAGPARLVFVDSYGAADGPDQEGPLVAIGPGGSA